MTMKKNENPAVLAAREAEKKMLACLDDKKSFVMEAGAGAGKTYSLVSALRYLIKKNGNALRKSNRRIACLTYTNAATAVVRARIDNDPLVFSDTIHAFCWSLIKPFQPTLRQEIAKLEAWKVRIEESGPIADQQVEYDLGYRRLKTDKITIHHDDVLSLTVALLALEKFRRILVDRYPFILIDEYQDTDQTSMEAIKLHLLGNPNGPVFGFFGDHWQRIYDKTCGHVDHKALTYIGKKSNFRSSVSVVDFLNRMRPELPQAVKDEDRIGGTIVFHTNNWTGTRRPGGPGGHWKGDLPAEEAHSYLNLLKARLEESGWEKTKTKILMLTHNVLAAEQGYPSITKLFTYTDSFIKKEDDYIAFFADKLEPACRAYESKRFGEMFALLGQSAPALQTLDEKVRFAGVMETLLKLRANGSVADVLAHIRSKGFPLLPDGVERREAEWKNWAPEGNEEMPRRIREARALQEVRYQEVTALTDFINGHTAFATKHSVKGDQFENVLVVLGRGWSKYNFGQYLEWEADRSKIPADKEESFERNRNLFYVCCSRPESNLALLFTQELSQPAMLTLEKWFGKAAIKAFEPNTA